MASSDAADLGKNTNRSRRILLHDQVQKNPIAAAATARMAGGGSDDDETLGAWALRYRGVATFGALALLLGTGKFLGFHWHRLAFLRRAVVPPSVISGLLGCVVYRMFKGLLSPGVKSSLDESLSEVGAMICS